MNEKDYKPVELKVIDLIWILLNAEKKMKEKEFLYKKELKRIDEIGLEITKLELDEKIYIIRELPF